MPRYIATDEEELLKRLANGDDLAFTELFNRYWSRLIALAYSHTKDKYQAEEIVQEVFMALWTRRNAVQINSLSAYLATSVKFSIFKHTARTGKKEKIVQHIATNILHLKSYDLPDELLHAKFLEDYTSQIVEELPEKCKLVYLSSREERLTIPEIAVKLNMADKTVEAHLTKALKTLRLHLKDVLMLALILRINR